MQLKPVIHIINIKIGVSTKSGEIKPPHSVTKLKRNYFQNQLRKTKQIHFYGNIPKNLKEPAWRDSLPETIKVNNRQTDASPDILNKYFLSISDKLKAEYGHDSYLTTSQI